LNKTLCHEIFAAFLKALDDYSTDNRGDVGSWVREAAIMGLDILTRSLVIHDTHPTHHGIDSLFPSFFCCSTLFDD
jgi:hypothetical protein